MMAAGSRGVSDMISRAIALTAALTAAAALLCGCAVVGAAVAVTGTAIGLGAKAVSATAHGVGDVIGGGKKDDKGGS
jgi:hypothetical protein